MRFSFFLALVFAATACFSQSEHLAQNYLDQGEYEKAESIFKKLLEGNPKKLSYFEGYVKALQEQEKYEKALNILTTFSQNASNHPGIDVEIGHNYSLQDNKEKARVYYNQALDQLERNPAGVYSTGKAFRSYNLLDDAEKAYKIGLDHQFNPNLQVELARVYGEQGKLEKMFSAFLDLLQQQDRYYAAVNRYFTQYIDSEKSHEANTILRSILVKRLQEEPLIVYNRLLSWLFIQEGNFRQAFTQEKAIYRRSEHPNLSKIIQIAELAADQKKYDDAEKMLSFARDEEPSIENKIQTQSRLFHVQIEKGPAASYPEIKKEFEKEIPRYRANGGNPFPLELQYAQFLAFKMDADQKGLSHIEELLKTPLSKQREAETRMIAADILVLQERFNQALIYYTQVKKLVKNTPLAQEALFKIAQTSYYKGDFDWAQTQLKVLKHATSELTANDAIALNLLIEENRGSDSTQTALKLLAKTDLYRSQEKPHKALQLTDSIIKNYEGKNIKETALFRQAQLQEQLKAYEKAATIYRQIIADYSHSIYMDDALYHLGELYRTALNDPKKAMEYYKTLIFEHADSIFYVEARKKYRQLRGDDIL